MKNKKINKFMLTALASSCGVASIALPLCLLTSCNNSEGDVILDPTSSKGIKITAKDIKLNGDSTIKFVIPMGVIIDKLIIRVDYRILEEGKDYAISMDGLEYIIRIKANKMTAKQVNLIIKTKTDSIKKGISLRVVGGPAKLEFRSSNYLTCTARLEISINGNDFVAVPIGSAIELKPDYLITIRGYNTDPDIGWSSDVNTATISLTPATAQESKVYLSGSLEFLLNRGGTLTDKPLGECGFDSLFLGSTALDIEPNHNDILPFTELFEKCYNNMFAGCTKLTQAPKLPATELAPGCYSFMFNNCGDLTTAPELPAKVLEERCYESMFKGCSNLVDIPALPATELSDYCYTSMFASCTSLKAAPELPSLELKHSCYANMFMDCNSLKTTPSILPAKTLQPYCYFSMFNGCMSLTTAPLIKATTLDTGSCRNMFRYCTSLTVNDFSSEPSDTPFFVCPADVSATQCVDNMFFETKGSREVTPVANKEYYVG